MRLKAIGAKIMRGNLKAVGKTPRPIMIGKNQVRIGMIGKKTTMQKSQQVTGHGRMQVEAEVEVDQIGVKIGHAHLAEKAIGLLRPNAISVAKRKIQVLTRIGQVQA